MKIVNKYLLLIGTILVINSCTNLDQQVYSDVVDTDFWQTDEQINSGIAPGYQAWAEMSTQSWVILNESSADAAIQPTRAGNFYNGGVFQEIWLHTWDDQNNFFDGTWETLYKGIGNVNLSLKSLDQLEDKPENIESIVAELEVLRDYYYFWAMDLFGNIPIVTDYNTPPDSVSNSSRQDVYQFLVDDITKNLPFLSGSTDQQMYGRINKWTAYSILAKLYLNSEIYTGVPEWEKAGQMCDAIIDSGNYSLMPGFFDNFSPDNGPDNTENIFVIPHDDINIHGMTWQRYFLHNQLDKPFGLSGTPVNGISGLKEFYMKFDTTSSYRKEGNKVYRTYEDQRSGQWLIGQQFSEKYPYPPDKDVLVEAEDSLKLKDGKTGLDLAFQVDIPHISSDESIIQITGIRNIKYFPQAGVPILNQGNDFVHFRYADILLMKAEIEARLGNTSNAANLVNIIRERAYGNSEHNWSETDASLENILNERARELTWEGWRRQDLIRYEVASGKGYFSSARIPDKNEDDGDYRRIFPIPKNQMISNPNLKQNPGY